jgi:hypothetical protein
MSSYFSGVWYNELGSRMTINYVSGGGFSGIYETAVGYAAGQYTLQGRYNTQPSSGGQAMAWAVAWQNAYLNSDSVTGWSGQYQTDPSTGAEEIYTLWLLASEMDPDEDWASTNVGQDTFSRTQPSAEEVERCRKARPASHPVKKPADG